MNNEYNELTSMLEISNQISSEDKHTLDLLINIIEKYDVYDLICRISALNLLIANQNKSILFDALIAKILSKGRTNYHSKIKMSSGKFKNIIATLTSLNFSMMIDPAENAFIERIQYYGNYWIFPGINYCPGYTLQAFLNVICLRNLPLPTEFTHKVHQLANFILHISDTIAQSLGYGIETIEHVEQKQINIPSAILGEKLSSCLRLNISYVKSMITDNSLRSKLFYNFDKTNSTDLLNGQQQDFFTHPFLVENEETVIVLNPSILASFLIHQIILLADEYAIKSNLIAACNDEMWKDCIKSFRALGHRYIIDEKKYGINLLNNNYRKEKMLTVCSDKLMFVHFVCDAGDEYTSMSMFGLCQTHDDFPTIYDRTLYLVDKMPGLHTENIYHVVLLASFGRVIQIKLPKDEHMRTIMLSPFELHCIAVNERNRNNFIPKYVDAKQRIWGLLPSMFVGELHNIEVYRSNDYSFYLSDDFNPKAGILFLSRGDSLDYVIRAIKHENRHLIVSYDKIHLCSVVLRDSRRNIYIADSTNKRFPESVNEFDKVAIWFTNKSPETMEELDLYNSIIDTLSYWLAECKEIINSMKFQFESIEIQILLSRPIEEYYAQMDGNDNLCEAIQYNKNFQKIIMTWHPSAFSILCEKTNQSEKNLIKSLLKELEQLSEVPADLRVLDDLFAPPLKKKLFSANIAKFPYLLPTNEPMQIISQEDEDQLLDEIGEHFLSFPEYDYGRVADDKRANLANNVVGYLYSLLQNEVASVKADGFFERVCLDLETVMYYVMRSQSRYAYDIACYPEKAKDIIKQNNDANKSSVALKFLAEYIAAIPPSGDNVLGSMQYDRILAICSLIVDWAYKNDLFKYHIFNSPVEFLKSGRIGMPRREGDYLFNINVAARVRKLESLSDPEIETYSYTNLWDDFQGKIDDAFNAEYGYTFQQFMQCIFAITAYGDGLEGEVKRVPRKTLVSEIAEASKLSTELLDNVINQISLTQRPDFLIPPAPFEQLDVYPWRFNRELSFTRRPIIQYSGDLIWGNRQLHHMWRYMIDLMMEGKFKAKSPKLKQLVGKFSHKRGNDFNAKVAKKLSAIKGIAVFQNLTKINGKRIAGIDGNVLGDIDILYIVPEHKKIVVGEVKDFSFAKNPYEMEQEYRRIFVDGDKPCYMTKHRRRVEWVKSHLGDVIQHFNLSGENWSVKSVMFVSEEIVSYNFYHQKGKIIVYSEITEQAVKNL